MPTNFDNVSIDHNIIDIKKESYEYNFINIIENNDISQAIEIFTKQTEVAYIIKLNEKLEFLYFRDDEKVKDYRLKYFQSFVSNDKIKTLIEKKYWDIKGSKQMFQVESEMEVDKSYEKVSEKIVVTQKEIEDNTPADENCSYDMYLKIKLFGDNNEPIYNTDLYSKNILNNLEIINGKINKSMTTTGTILLLKQVINLMIEKIMIDKYYIYLSCYL